jgi:hypothetical protein
MSRRFWKRLAGCIVIKCALAAVPEYRAGTAVIGEVKAVALEDNRGHRAVFAEADFPVTRAIADFIAARLASSYALDRSSLVLSGMALRPAHPEDVITAISAALGSLESAKVVFDGAKISITSKDGKCLATIPQGPCAGGAAVRPPIRTAFQIFEPPHSLQQRGETPPSYPVQAIALGKTVTVLALSGDTEYPQSKGLLVLTHSNDINTASDPTPAIRSLLQRVQQ